MNIVYQNTKQFTKKQLEDLFLSVEWSSGHYPEKLVTAMNNFSCVFSAWDDDHPIGLISAMDDGVMTAYIHYLLVHPKYQHQGIGRQLIMMTKEHYRDYLRIVLIGYNQKVPFYESCGFTPSNDSTPLFITSLWT